MADDARALWRMTARTGSIRWRMSLVAALAIGLTLILSGLGLTILFDRQVTRLAAQELEAQSTAIIAGFEPDEALPVPADDIGGDRRYLSPYSGLYWQIEVSERSYRSQSLWDTVLAVTPEPPPPGAEALYEAGGPDGQRLLILDRNLRLGPTAAPLRVSVAVSRASLDEAKGYFERGLILFLLALGGLLIAGSVAQVAIGLRPFGQVHRLVSDLNQGERDRIGQDVPSEVQPLAAAIDALLDDRDTRVARARNRAMDLAHTLKTPMQAILAETRHLRERGEGAAADHIDEIVETIRSRVDRELGRNRIHGSGRARLAEVAGNVARVLSRTPRGEEIALEVGIAPELVARIDPYDLTEALGSIAENALRHARGRVAIRAVRQGGWVDLTIEDDGRGVPEPQLAQILQRGASLDGMSDGSGVGLSLADEITAAAGGTLRLENLPGGFRVTLRLKAD